MVFKKKHIAVFCVSMNDSYNANKKQLLNVCVSLLYISTEREREESMHASERECAKVRARESERKRDQRNQGCKSRSACGVSSELPSSSLNKVYLSFT